MVRYFAAVIPVEQWTGSNVDEMRSFLAVAAPDLSDVRQDPEASDHLLAGDVYGNTWTFEIGDTWYNGSMVKESELRNGYREL